MASSASLTPKPTSLSAHPGPFRTRVRAVSIDTDDGYHSSSSGGAYQKSPRSGSSTPSIRSPLALSPTITIRGSPRSPRHEDRRPRSASLVPCIRRHHPHKSPPRSPHDVELMYGSALAKVGTEAAGVADEIITRQSEILARKHDIAVWQRKIHAAEKLISGLQEQVDVLVQSAREKQDMEKELACQRDALLANEGISEREFNALGVILGDLDIKHRYCGPIQTASSASTLATI